MIVVAIIDDSLAHCAITAVDMLRAWHGLRLDPDPLFRAPERDLALILDRELAVVHRCSV